LRQSWPEPISTTSRSCSVSSSEDQTLFAELVLSSHSRPRGNPRLTAAIPAANCCSTVSLCIGSFVNASFPSWTSWVRDLCGFHSPHPCRTQAYRAGPSASRGAALAFLQTHPLFGGPLNGELLRARLSAAAGSCSQRGCLAHMQMEIKIVTGTCHISFSPKFELTIPKFYSPQHAVS
jgi:hypothetical protein